jgi:hypothetical protein
MLLSNKALPACGVDQRRGSPPKPVGSRALPGRAFSVLPQASSISVSGGSPTVEEEVEILDLSPPLVLLDRRGGWRCVPREVKAPAPQTAKRL